MKIDARQRWIALAVLLVFALIGLKQAYGY